MGEALSGLLTEPMVLHFPRARSHHCAAPQHMREEESSGGGSWESHWGWLEGIAISQRSSSELSRDPPQVLAIQNEAPKNSR